MTLKKLIFIGLGVVLGIVVGVAMSSLSTGPVQNHSETKRVVTTFTILQDMAQNVGGDKVIVESITKPGAEIHEYEPTPLDIVKAQDVVSHPFDPKE